MATTKKTTVNYAESLKKKQKILEEAKKKSVGAGSAATPKMTEQDKKFLGIASALRADNAVTGTEQIASRTKQNIYTPGQSSVLKTSPDMMQTARFRIDLEGFRTDLLNGSIFDDPEAASMIRSALGDDDEESIRKLTAELDKVLGINISTYDSQRARSGDWSVLDGLDEGSDQYKEYNRLLRLAGYDTAKGLFTDALPEQAQRAGSMDPKQSMMMAAAGDLGKLGQPVQTYQDLMDLQRDYTREEAEKDLGIISGYLDGYVGDYAAYEQAAQNLSKYFGGDWSLEAMRAKTGAGVPILGENNIPWYDDTLAKYDADSQLLRDKLPGQNFTYEDYLAYVGELEDQQRYQAEQQKFTNEWNSKMEKWDAYWDAPEYAAFVAQRDKDDAANPYDSSWGNRYNAFKGAMRGDQNDETGFKYMTETELERYDYLSKEVGEKEAKAYLDDVQEDLYRRRQMDINSDIAAAVNENGANAALMWVGARSANAFDSMFNAPKNIFRAVTGQEINPYDPSFDEVNYKQIVDSANVQNISDSIDSKVLGYILSRGYQAGSSLADSYIAALIGGGKLASPMLGANTFNATLQEGLQAGETQLDAVIDAAVDGLIEVGTEKFSIDALLGNGTSALKHLGKNIITEPTEEIFGEVLRETWDAIRNGEDSEFNRRISELQYQGYTPEEALRQAWKERGRNVLETALVSAISGGMGGTTGAVNIATTNKKYGNAIADSKSTERLLEIAETLDMPEEVRKLIAEERAALPAKAEVAQQEAEAPAETASEEAVDEFDESTAEAATEAPAASDETTEQKPVEKSGKNKDKVATSSPARLGRIFREVWQRVDEDAKNVLVDTFSAKNVRRMIDEYSDLDRVQPDELMKDQLAKVTTKAIVDPANMTEEERKMLMSSKSAMHVLDEMTAAIATKKAATDKLDQLSGMLRKGGATAQNPQLQQMIDLPEELTPDGRTLQQYAEEYGKQADIMHDAHNVGQDAGKYAQQFRTAFNYGRDGRNVESILGESNLSYLTKDQIRTAYELGRDVRVQTAAEQRRVNPTGVTVGNVDRSAIADIKLNQAQHASVSALSRLAKAVGFNLKVVASTANAEGKYTDKNGSWDRATRTLTIDINAGRVSTKDANYAMMQTAGHELTHYIKQFADSDLYNEYQEFVLGHLSKKMGNETLDDRIRSTVAGNAKLGKTLTREQAIDEIVADASGDALLALTVADIREMAQTKPTLLRTIGKFFEKWVNRVKARIRMGYEGTTESNAVAKQMADVADELGRKWVALLKDANVRASESTGELLVTTKQGAVVSADVAEIMNSDRYEAPDNGLFSVRETDAWAEAHRKEYPNDTNFADNLALIQKFDADVVQDAVLRYLVPHGRVKKTAHGPLRDNIEYVYTFDMDTKCERTYQFLAYRNAVQKKIGRQLTENEARNLIELMRAYGQMIPCTYCYVEGKRMTLADLYLKYIEKNSASALGTARSAEEIFDGVERARTIVSGWLNDRFNITDNYAVDSKYASDSFEGYRDFKMPITEEQAVDELCERYSITDKAAKKVIAGYVAEWVYNRQMDLPMQLVNEDADFRTDAIEQDVLSFHDRATKAAQGGAKARGIEDYEPYVDQVKNISLEDKAYINGMGGIRKHSSNDFQIQNVQDYMLFFMDLAADKRGGIDWMGHTYTKNLDYARIFAPTNDRINVSIAMYGDKNTGIRPNTQEGVDWEELKRVRAKYKNVGAMAMVTNNDQLSLALNSDWIDMIIPFHASGMKRSLYRGLGWLDYTSKQSERVYTKGQMVDMLREIGIPVKASAKAAEVQQLFMENFDIKTVFNEKTGKRIAPHFFPGDTVQHGVLIPGHHNNAQRYFELCREYGVNPRFYGINVEDAKGNLIPITDHPGYLKLIKETARTDTPQEPIVAKFDMDAVNSAMKAFKGYANLSEDAYGIVDEFVNEYVGKNRPFRYLTERAKETQAIIEEMSAQEQAKRDRMRERMLENIQKYGEEGVAENATTGESEFMDDESVSFSVRETDTETLEFLNGQETVTTYKTMQIVDGKLYPPMAAVVAGRYEDASVLGQWEKATERPDLIKLDKKGKPQFNLNKGQGKGNVPAAYNPYMHSSNLVLNDQFSSAYDRPNLVTVECEVPVSELTSGYHAQYAKDSVGWHSWHTGTVAGALRRSKGIERQVLLSRWIKPVRIVPDAEVAQMYKELLDGTGIAVPDNVVPPSLLTELKNAGVEIAVSGKVPSSNDDVQFSVREVDGAQVVWIDDNIMKDKPADATIADYLVDYMTDHVGEVYKIIESGQNVYLGSDLPKEYAWSKYSQRIRKRNQPLYRAKARMASGVGDAINIATNRRWEKTKHPGNKDAVYGIYKYDTKVAFPTYNEAGDFTGVQAYDITLVIRNASNGRKYLYDVQNIKKDAFTANTLYSKSRGAAMKAAQQENIFSAPIVADSAPDVNLQIRDPYQLSDREILANTMESVALNKDELDILQRYKARVAEYGEYQKQLEEINSGIVRMKKEKASRDDIIKEQNRAQILLNKIDKLDRRLAERERTTAIKALVGRERERVRTEQQKSLRQRDVAQLTERLDREKTRYAEMKGKYEQELAEQKQKVKDVRAEKNESFAREKYRAEVIKAADKLRTMVTTPTNKERVPEILRKSMGDFLDALDFSSESSIDGKGSTKADEKLKDAMDRMHNALANVRKAQEQGAAESGWLDLPDGYVEEFDNLRLKIGTILGMTDHFDTPINRMDSETLHDLAKAFRILHASINNMNRLIANAKFESARSAAGSTIGALAKLARQKDYNTLMQTASDFLDWKNTVPYYAFKRFGEGGKAIFEALMNGWDKLANNSAEIIEFTEKTYSAKEVREWERKIREVTLSNGDTVRMTTAQLMSLYCLAKREQAVGHLLGGGIRVGDIDSKGMAVRQTKNHKLTKADLRTFSGMLTQREREVADALQKYMATQGAKWGNYVSMKRFGYNMFTEEHYFPIKSDQNNIGQKDVPDEGNSLYRLLNMSATKELTKNANNALVVDSIFDVFTSHMADMAKYNALGLEILDALKWINYVERTQNPDGTVDTLSVREKMEGAYGAEARNYIMEFLRNLNGETEGGREDKLISKGISNYKIAAVGANIRVALLQITSMPRAAYVISPKYLAVGLAKWNAGGWKNSKKAVENVGIAKWKSMGFYDTNVSRNLREMIKHDESALDKTHDYGMKLAEWGDAWTMGVLYGAVEAELAAKGIREGHSDFKRQMNNRMREIIYQTQVVDSTMTRSHLMRQKGLMSQLTSFMSEPTLTMNLINDALFDARMKIRSGEGNWFPGVLKQTAKAFGVTGFGLAASAVIEALMTGFRDDDEYEKSLEKFMDALIGDYSDAETFGQKMTEFWSSSIGGNLNLLSNIPIVKQYLEAAQGNSVELNFFDWIKESKTGVETLYKAIMEDGSIADYYRGVYKIATGASQATGIAVSGAMRDLVAMYNTFVARPAGWRRIQTYDNTEREAAQAIFDAENAGDTTLAQRYRERFKLYGMDEKKFNDAMSKLAQEAYIGGEITEARASEVMKASGKSNRNVDKALTAADYEIATGLEHGDMKDDFVDGTITEAQAKEYLKKYNGMRDREIDEKLGEWKYEKDTGNTYSGMKDDFLDGVLTKDQAINHRVKYGGAERGDAEETVMKWQYEKDTGLVYSELKLDYEDGVITESQLRNALAKYGGKDPEKVEETVSNYDYQIATGRTTTAPKYWRIAYAFDTGKDADTLIQQAFDDIMYGGEKTKSWKQARSQIASSLAAYYKKDYLAVKGTAKGAQMLERILDLYEKIGYSRSYQTQYIEENWTDD